LREVEFIDIELRGLAPYVREQYADRRHVAVEGKSGAQDLLTAVDLEVQRRLVDAIERTYPGDLIVAEESGLHEGNAALADRCWVIDPIDGTQNFVRGLFPEFGVSVAFGMRGRVIAGGVGVSGQNTVFLAEHGAGATRDGDRISVSKIPTVGLARIDIDFGYPHEREETLELFADLIVNAGQFRCYCASVMGLCAVACGETDVYAAKDTQPWDSAAGALLVEEAGGRVTDHSGNPIPILAGKTPIFVSNGLIHDEALAMVPAKRGR